MPKYEYICDNCEEGAFWLKQSFSSKPVADCPNCGKACKRKISQVSVVFKGSGWYVNDNRGTKQNEES